MKMMERYIRLLDKKADIIRRINEAKERGDQTEVEKLEETELYMLECDLEEIERQMSPTYSTFKEECESDRSV